MDEIENVTFLPGKNTTIFNLTYNYEFKCNQTIHLNINKLVTHCGEHEEEVFEVGQGYATVIINDSK